MRQRCRLALLLAAVAGAAADDKSCSKGPIPGTVAPGADVAACLGRAHDDLCFPSCGAGYAARPFVLLCEDGRFNASLGVCDPNPCSGGPASGEYAIPGGDLEHCELLRTGQTCAPRCATGFRIQTSFELHCDAPGFTFTAPAGELCIPNGCMGGPVSRNVDPFADFAECNTLKTGDYCKVHCSAGTPRPEEFQLTCFPGTVKGQEVYMYDPVVDCEMPVVHPPADCTKLEDCDCAHFTRPDYNSHLMIYHCAEYLHVWASDWRPPAIEMYGAQLTCHPLPEPPLRDNKNLVMSLYPLQTSLPGSATGLYAGCLLLGMSCCVLLWLIAWSGLRQTAWAFGVQYWLYSVLLPGMAYSAARIQGDPFGDHVDPEKGNALDWGLAAAFFPFTIVEFATVYYCVLRPKVFRARWEVLHDDSLRTLAWLVGDSCWASTDIDGTFRWRAGFVFCWYNGRTRWFLLCEMSYALAVGLIAGWMPNHLDGCRVRFSALTVVAFVWFCVLVGRRPMRSKAHNVLASLAALLVVPGLITLNVGTHEVKSNLYLAGNTLLYCAGGTQLLRAVMDWFMLLVELWNTRMMRVTGAHEEFGKQCLMRAACDELVAGLGALHTRAGELSPRLSGVLADEVMQCGAAVPVGGIAERLSGGLDKRCCVEWTPEQLRERLQGLEELADCTGDCAEGALAEPLLQWLEGLPARWSSEFGLATRKFFYSEDILCSGRHLPRQEAGAQVKVCCISYNLRSVVRRILTEVVRTQGLRMPWVRRLRAVTPADPDATDGVTAALIYTYECLRPGGNGESREVQIYGEMNRAMRELGDAVVAEGVTPMSPRIDSGSAFVGQSAATSERMLRFFLPLALRLDRFLLQMHETKGGPGYMVFRGITVRVAQKYRTGTHFLWSSFSSTSAESSVARSFMQGAGSLFIVAQRRACDISWASVFPGEAERVLPSNTILTVMSKLPDNMLALLDTNSDVLVVMEYDARRPLTPKEAVNLSLVATMESSFLYEDFGARYVEPSLASDTGAARRLYGEFDDFLTSKHRVLLITGDAGTGKTSTSLALVANLVERAKHSESPDDGVIVPNVSMLSAESEESPESPSVASVARRCLGAGYKALPVFVHLPWAEGLLDPGDTTALARHVQRQLHLDQQPGAAGEQLAELKRRPLVLFLDSVDELRGSVDILKRDSLLQRGGISFFEWPLTKFVVTCRGEYIEQHGLELRHFTTDAQAARQVRMLPFSDDDVRQYVQQIAAVECRKLAHALHGLPAGDVDRSLENMRTIKLFRPEAIKLQRALQGRKERRVAVAELTRVKWSRADGGGIRGSGMVVRRINGVEVNKGSVGNVLRCSPGDTVVIDTYEPYPDKDQAVQEVMMSHFGQQCIDIVCRATNTVIRRFHHASQGMLGVPFVLSMVVSAAPKLDLRPCALVNAEPRCQVYEVWIRANITERLPRLPILSTMIRDTGLREEVVMAAAVRLACSMYADGEWHSTVGQSLGRLDHDHADECFQRALLGAMPLRVESVDRDSAPLTWRHRSLQEFLIARCVAADTNAAVLSARSFSHAPMVVHFFQERLRALRTLHPVRGEEVETGLRAAQCAASGALRGQNAAMLLEGAAGDPGAPHASGITYVELGDPQGGDDVCVMGDVDDGADWIPLGATRVSVGVSRLHCYHVQGEVSLTATGDNGGDYCWLQLSGGQCHGEGDPFHEQAARIDFNEAPDDLRFFQLFCRCEADRVSELPLLVVVSDRYRDRRIGEATRTIETGLQLPLCSFRRPKRAGAGGWQVCITLGSVHIPSATVSATTATISDSGPPPPPLALPRGDRGPNVLTPPAAPLDVNTPVRKGGRASVLRREYSSQLSEPLLQRQQSSDENVPLDRPSSRPASRPGSVSPAGGGRLGGGLSTFVPLAS